MVGIIEEIINNGKGKGSGVRIAGHKYGVYDPADAGLEELSVGTTVSLRFNEKDAGGGIVYKNVAGKITTVKDGAPVTAVAATTTGGASKGGFRKNGEEGGFPINARAYERALDRRNALQCASGLAIGLELDADGIIALAKQFEAYSCGDDMADADAARAFLDELPED